MVYVKRLLILLLLFSLLMPACIDSGGKSDEVVVYVAHDQDYSEPILRAFEEETGIRVKTLYDTEATKTTGLVNKLIAEKNRPQADVFWNNEVSRTIVLKNNGILETYCSPNAADVPAIYKDPECYWTGFGARARIILYNLDLVSREDAPDSLMDLTDPKWEGKTCIANPLFGSTASHVASLFAYWGDDEAIQYFTGLKENNIMIVESNGMVRDLVVSGECYIGLTDTDDANDALVENKPVAMVFPDQDGMGTLVFPNSVMLIKNGPNPENGKKLVDYLLSRDVERELAYTKAMQIPLKPGVERPENVPDVDELKNIPVTPEELYNKLNVSQVFVQELFIR
ncbi:MAG: extracellular solute-binding protein [Candidatus Altiarchaeota archaeon]|nr:extracellular solute-binding protein [Candidatus Altiarchaeota archaeon]